MMVRATTVAATPATVETRTSRSQRVERVEHTEREPRGDRTSAMVVVVWIAGVLGAIGILWFGVATLLGLHVVIFKTGSMGVTAPVGSAAIEREVSWQDVAVGDVITVQRTGAELPITHRVVSITPDADGSGAEVVMKGDANDTADAIPYEIDRVGKALVIIPGIGAVLDFAKRPLILGLATLGVSAAIMWAFWPQRQQLLEQAASHRRDRRPTSQHARRRADTSLSARRAAAAPAHSTRGRRAAGGSHA